MTTITRQAFALLIILGLAGGLSAATAPSPVWGRQLGTSVNDFAGALAVDAAGYCYLAGATAGDLAGKNAGRNDIIVAKFDPAGRLVWLRQFGTAEEDGARAIAVDRAGNIFVAGETRGRLGREQFGGTDGFVARLDPSGVVQWIQQFGSAGEDAGRAIACNASGDVFVTGVTAAGAAGTPQSAPDAFVRQFAPTGASGWVRQWGTGGAEDARSIAVGPQGDLFVTGATTGDLGGHGNAGKTDLFVTKLDPAGNVAWSRQFGTPEPDTGMKLLVDDAGGIYVGGSTGGAFAGAQAGQGDALLLKLSPAGDLVWKRQFGTARWDGIHGLAFSPDGNGGVVVGGCQNWDQCQAFLRAFDTNGIERWQTTIPTKEITCGTQIGIDAGGNLYQVGGTHGPAFGPYAGEGTDVFLVKLSTGPTPVTP